MLFSSARFLQQTRDNVPIPTIPKPTTMICCRSREGIRERLREPPLDPSGMFYYCLLTQSSRRRSLKPTLMSRSVSCLNFDRKDILRCRPVLANTFRLIGPTESPQRPCQADLHRPMDLVSIPAHMSSSPQPMRWIG